MNRLFYSLWMAYLHRQALTTLYQHSAPSQNILTLTPEILVQQGVKVLVLDFDGVLASHGELLPSPEVEIWLETCLKVFPAENIFLLSNKPLPERLAYFGKYGIRCISHVRKKPYPDGLLKIQTLANCASKEILLADDRLLTGGLATCIAQTQIYYVTKPFVALDKRPFSESIFICLRWIERCSVSIYGKLTNQL